MATDRLDTYDIFAIFMAARKNVPGFRAGRKVSIVAWRAVPFGCWERYESFRANRRPNGSDPNMTTFRHALILVQAALLLTGAKPADSLRATFADPGAEYRPVPFWHLNGRLSSDEIVRQIEDAKNLAGFGGVTVLPVSPGAQHPTGKPCPGMEPA